MKAEESIMGLLIYEQKEFPFLYEKEVLKIMPPTNQEWFESKWKIFNNYEKTKQKEYEEWIGTSLLKGITYEGKQIVFGVSDLNSNNNGCISYQVIYYLKYDYEEYINENSINGFQLTGREINYFFDPIKSFHYKMSYDNSTKMFEDFNAEKIEEEVGSYLYKETEIIIKLCTFPTYYFDSETPLLAKSEINVIFSQPRDLNFTVDVIHHFRKLLYYVCRRSNIQLDDIQVYGIRNQKKRIEGVIHECLKKDDEEIDTKKNKRIIKYEILNKKCISILTSISDDTMYFEHLCPSIESTHSYGISRVILNFVAFEREFRNIYKDVYVRSEEYEQVKQDVLDSLSRIRDNNSGKKKKYVNEFIRTIEKKENSLFDKMEYALKDCEEIMQPFLIFKYHSESKETIESICQRMNTLRNDSAHGNIDLNVEPIHLTDFAILEILLYAMRLKNIGVNLENIQYAIKDLMGYNIVLKPKNSVENMG